MLILDKCKEILDLINSDEHLTEAHGPLFQYKQEIERMRRESRGSVELRVVLLLYILSIADINWNAQQPEQEASNETSSSVSER